MTGLTSRDTLLCYPLPSATGSWFLCCYSASLFCFLFSLRLISLSFLFLSISIRFCFFCSFASLGLALARLIASDDGLGEAEAAVVSLSIADAGAGIGSLSVEETFFWSLFSFLSFRSWVCGPEEGEGGRESESLEREREHSPSGRSLS
jgi:hypothetical protein